MTKNITYLLGAGASRNGVPIQSEIASAIVEFANYLRVDSNCQVNSNDRLDFVDAPDALKTKMELISDLEWLHGHVERTGAVDTFAHQLFHKKDERQLRRLKIAYSICFMYWQAIKNADLRYRNFLNQILSPGKAVIRDAVKILSWNYDYQVEKIASEYFGFDRLLDVQRMLGMYSANFHQEDTPYSFFKLNGTMGVERIEPFVIDLNPGFLDSKGILTLLNNYALMKYINNGAYKPTFAFAFENNALIEIIKRQVRQTEILICIGYSFPNSNADIDMRIIGAMLQNLEEIYIQDPNYNGIREELENRLRISYPLQAKKLHIETSGNKDVFRIVP